MKWVDKIRDEICEGIRADKAGINPFYIVKETIKGNPGPGSFIAYNFLIDSAVHYFTKDLVQSVLIRDPVKSLLFYPAVIVLTYYSIGLIYTSIGLLEKNSGKAGI